MNAVNRASLKFDPINWELFTNDLQTWCLKVCKHPGNFCELTREKFLERSVPPYAPRTPTPNPSLEPSRVFHYYDFRVPQSKEPTHLQKYIKDIGHREEIAKMNKHDRLAGILGVL